MVNYSDQQYYVNPEDGFRLISEDSLVHDRRGKYFRQWRRKERMNDIWQEIVNVSHLPGLLQHQLMPIAAEQ